MSAETQDLVQLVLITFAAVVNCFAAWSIHRSVKPRSRSILSALHRDRAAERGSTALEDIADSINRLASSFDRERGDDERRRQP